MVRSVHGRGHRTIHLLLAAVLAVTLGACSDDGVDAADDGQTVGEGDAYRATIRRTEGGVPHITGDSMTDVAFGQGWASGEDRTCDLADQVVKVSSQRARWFGPGEDDANVDSDVAWLAIGVAERSAQDWADTPTDVASLVTAFTDGWNAHLDEVGADGVGGWCAGEPWVRPLEPVEVYTYARAISVQASGGAVASYIPSAAPPGAADTDAEDEAASGAGAEVESAAWVAPTVASNGWAIGSDRSAGGGGMLVANPHFPWYGEARFWECHLTLPGELDVYGAALLGVPGVQMGFNRDVAWAHTFSKGHRFTMYRLDLVPGAPTSYRFGDEEREMTSATHSIEVLGDDGSLDSLDRTLWSTHHGPMVNLPLLGWGLETAFCYRDANLGNTRVFEQFLGMDRATSLDELKALSWLPDAVAEAVHAKVHQA